MSKLIAMVVLAVTMTGCAEFKAAGYDPLNEKWGTVKVAGDARCGITGLNQCWGKIGSGGGGAGAGSR